ncbi:MAG: hypothetical protein J1F39_05950 [Clostridiales bacterium]|nr:hypothetical protein [Clostridiales bacterium]
MAKGGGCLPQIFGFLRFWTSISNQYERIKSDPVRREKSVSMGVRSIIQTLLCAVIAAASFYGGIYIATHFIGAVYEVITLVFWIAGVAAMFLVSAMSVFMGIIGGLMYLIYQFRLNKRAIRWIALVVWIIAVIAAVAAVIVLLNIIG